MTFFSSPSVNGGGEKTNDEQIKNIFETKTKESQPYHKETNMRQSFGSMTRKTDNDLINYFNLNLSCAKNLPMTYIGDESKRIQCSQKKRHLSLWTNT